MRSLLNACLSLSPNDALRKWTYQGLLGVLAVTGMRLSEALSLRLSDVDLVMWDIRLRFKKEMKSARAGPAWRSWYPRARRIAR